MLHIQIDPEALEALVDCHSGREVDTVTLARAVDAIRECWHGNQPLIAMVRRNANESARSRLWNASLSALRSRPT